MRIVTTYPPKDWDIYVKRNLKSWVEYADAEIVAYNEDVISHPVEGVREEALFSIPELSSFLDSIEYFAPAHGLFKHANGEQLYDYNFNASKWCRKVFVQANSTDYNGIVVWLDADVLMTDYFDEGMALELLGGKPIAYYDRENFHPEAGIVIYDMRSARAHAFVDKLKWLYISGFIFRNPHGWHDCWAMWMLLQDQVMKDCTTNLGEGWDVQTDGLEVMDHGPTAAYLRHDKGNKKYERGA